MTALQKELDSLNGASGSKVALRSIKQSPEFKASFHKKEE